jgi:head-tail adaptor
MRAGLKNATVTVQRPNTTQNAGGGTPLSPWVTVGNASTSARIETQLVPETVAAAQPAAIIGHVVTLDWCTAHAAMTPAWRLVWGSRELRVQAFENVGNLNRELKVLCREVQGKTVSL